ncbi:MAG: aldo/keto reductase [Thermoanaerobaculia bacterium]
MQRRPFGNTGLSVSVLGFGGAEIGLEHADAGDVERLLAGAIDAGLNVIDTASAYLESEELIGRVLGERRRDVLLFTKCGATDGFARSDWSLEGILGQIEQSLRMLRTDHLDLVQLHSCDREVLRGGDAIEALRRAREKGWTRFIGYSGDGDDALFAIECGVFDSLQTSLSVADQESIELTIPKARERGMAIIAKRPLANVAWRWDSAPPDSYHHAYWNRLRELRYPELEGDVSTAAGIALRFTLGVEGVSTAIVGTKTPGRWQENARVVEAGPLTPEVRDSIRRRWKQVAHPDWSGQV